MGVVWAIGPVGLDGGNGGKATHSACDGTVGAKGTILFNVVHGGSVVSFTNFYENGTGLRSGQARLTSTSAISR